MSLDRRTFLQTSAVALGAAACLPRCGSPPEAPPVAPPEPEPDDGATIVDFDPASLPEDSGRFPLGVQAGAMTSTSALLWTSGTPARLRVWREAESAGQVKLVTERSVEPTGGFVKVTVDGLGPGHYRYAFFDADLTVRSTIGRFRTAFGPGDLRPLTLGGMACSNFERRPYTALELLAAEAPDVLCHLGDMSYNDGAVSLEDYREKWRETLSDPGYRAVLSAAGIHATWDDHEIGNNFNPETLDPEQLEAATRAYFEHLPLAESPRRLWGSTRWGDTAELFVLDCRGERRPSTLDSEAPIYVGEEQFEWLLDAVAASPCRFKVLLSSVPITRLFGLWNIGLKDRWEGYGRQRDQLLEHLTTRVSGRVLFLTGDFHCGFVSRVEPEGPASNLFEVAVGPTAARAPNPIAILHDTGDLPKADSFAEDRFLFGTGSTRNATTVTLDPLRDEVRVRFVDARAETRGQVLYDGLIPYV